MSNLAEDIFQGRVVLNVYTIFIFSSLSFLCAVVTLNPLSDPSSTGFTGSLVQLDLFLQVLN